MKDETSTKLKVTCLRIAMLMEHQQVLPDLKELALQLYPSETDQEYLQGAQDALNYLISFLEQKGH